mgnify:FL=1
MHIVFDFSHETPGGLVQYINESLLEFDDPSSDHVLMNGLACARSKEIQERYKDRKRKSLLALWSPCEFLESPALPLTTIFDWYAYFDDVYCVCPFTVKYMNSLYDEDKFKYIPYPFTNYSCSPDWNKEYTSSWFGGVHGSDHMHGINEITKHKYKFLTKQQFNSPVVTHFDVSTEQKFIEINECKSSLSFNLLYPSSSLLEQNSHFVRDNKGAFSHAQDMIAPQFKVRTHEIASVGALILCKKDPWNLIEDFYNEGAEYVSFSTFEELRELLKDISANWDNYVSIAKAGYSKSQFYTIEKMINYIENNDESLITWSLANVR